MYLTTCARVLPQIMFYYNAVADPGFPVEEERRPPTQVLFGKNLCKNERIETCWGGGTGSAPWIHQCNDVLNFHSGNKVQK